MAIKHGIFTQQLPSTAFAARLVNTAAIFAVGAAPGGRSLQTPIYATSFSEVAAAFGVAPSKESEADYGLLRLARVLFGFYGVGPVVFVNVLDPDDANHKTSVAMGEAHTFTTDTITVGRAGLTSLVVKNEGETVTYVEDTDYTVDASAGTITRLGAGSIGAAAVVHIGYDYADPAGVAAADVVGAAGPPRTGLELLEEVFTRFNVIPTLLIAPGFTDDATVAAALVGKSNGYFQSGGSGLFKALALLDAPASDTQVADAIAWKATYSGDRTLIAWPRWTAADVEDPLSYHLAGVIARTDADSGSLPHVSPSNNALAPGKPTIGGSDIFLSKGEADLANDNGIVTSFRFGPAGWVVWGNYTAAHPSTTDPVDLWIPVKRMFDFVAHTLITSTWQFVDRPGNSAQINRVLTLVGQMMNGWEAAGALLPGHSIAFLPGDNPETDVLAGIYKFRVTLTPPTPMQAIEHLLEFDASALSTLFVAA